MEIYQQMVFVTPARYRHPSFGDAHGLHSLWMKLLVILWWGYLKSNVFLRYQINVSSSKSRRTAFGKEFSVIPMSMIRNEMENVGKPLETCVEI